MIGGTKITFGMIVLNGEPFVLYNLRGLYPFAYQIIVVEGAVPDASCISTPSGHSSDDTLAILHFFKTTEDPENKVVIVTAEDEGYPNGFWPGEKDEQSRAYARRATGNYLWQVDSDEFYKSEDIRAIQTMLDEDPTITAVSFPMITFWGGFDYWVDGWYLRRGASTYHRLFKWGADYQYYTHRPPTVLDDHGRNTREINWIHSYQIEQKNIFLYHYSLLLPQQVEDKITFYEKARWIQRTGAKEWMNNSYNTLKRPFRVHNVYAYPSWLERYHGSHPAEALMMRDILSKTNSMQMRKTDDVERLLSSRFYQIGKKVLIILDYFDRVRIFLFQFSRKLVKKIFLPDKIVR